MKHALLLVFCALLVISSPASAKDVIPYKEFIQYTDACLDALDRIEAYVLTSPPPGLMKSLFTEMDASTNRYNRYGTPLPKGKQQEIVVSLLNARLGYDIFFMTKGKDAIDQAEKDAAQARKLYLAYKKKGGK